MLKPSIFHQISTYVRQLLHPLGAASTALGAGQSALNTSVSPSSSTRYIATQRIHDLDTIDTIQQKYREELGAAVSRRIEGMIAETFIKGTYGLTQRQYETLQVYDLPILHVSKYDWTLFDYYSPDGFRQAFPEYYI